MSFRVPQFVFALFNKLERVAAIAQGKSYGSTSIAREVSLLESFLTEPPKLAIDIGGNAGHYTAELRRRTPGLEIHIFEPSKTNIDRITARFANDPLITLMPFAVSDEKGAATLFSNEPGSGLGSLTKRNLDHLNVNFDLSESVQMVRFDDYWTEALGERPIDLVKLDIEGHEMGALRGFGAALAKVKVLQFEFGGCNIDTRSFFRDFWTFFQDNGFDLYRITPIGVEHISRYRESDEFFSTTNYIAVNRNPG